MNNTATTISRFDRTVEELLYFGDCLKLREKHVEQQHVTELNQQKSEFNVELQKEKKRIEQVQQINKILAKQIEEATKHQIDLNEKYAVRKDFFN